MNPKASMASFTGYLVGKVQLDCAIQSEMLTSLVATLFERYSTSTDPRKKCLKFSDNIKYNVECSDRGLKLTSPGVKPKDEGFESDCDSIRSIPLISNTSTKIKNGTSKLNSSSSSGNSSKDSSELDLCDLMNHLDISKQHDGFGGKESERSNGTGGGVGSGSVQLPSLSSTSSGNSTDNTSISSSQNIQISDDNNSSSGNGSDSDEFCTNGNSLMTTADGTAIKDVRSSLYWEILPNLSSFQSYPIEDVVFCHCDVVHPNVLVWVVRHLAKMVALVIAFRTRAETEQLFQKYRELRVSVKPVKTSMKKLTNASPSIGPKLSEVPPALSVPITLCPPQQLPIPADSELVPYSSLPHVMPTEILYESKSKSPLFFTSRGDSKCQDYNFDDGVRTVGSKISVNNQYSNNSVRTGHSNTINSYNKLTRSSMISQWSSSSSSLIKTSTLQSSSSSSPIIFPHRQQHHFLHSNIKRFDGLPSLPQENNANESEEDFESAEVESQQETFKSPLRTLRKTGDATTSTSTVTSILQTSKPATTTTKSSTIGKSSSAKPVVLVPLKTETVSSSPRPIYPKESYLYHVMGRTASTFAPYQRSINFLPQYAAVPNANNGTEYFQCGNERQGTKQQQQLLVPFSSWMEISELSNKLPSGNNTVSRKVCYAIPKTRSGRNGSRTSALAQLNMSKGTAKILLRDSAGNHHGMWATLSQRFKRNIRESLMQKFNGVWPNGPDNAIGRKKKVKKVTFNAWATVQMV